MATPSIIAVYQDAAAGGAEVVVPGIAVGDWLVADVGNAYADDSATLDLEPAAVNGDTWSPIGVQVGDSDNLPFENMHGAAHYLEATTAGDGTVTVTGQGNNVTHLVVLHLSDCAAVEDVSDHVAAQDDGAAATSWPIGPIVTSTSDALLVGQWGGVQFDADLNWAAPASMVEQAETDSGDGFSAFMVATETLTASGDTGTRTGTASTPTNNGFAGKLFAISGAAGGAVETTIGRAGATGAARPIVSSKATALGRAGTAAAPRPVAPGKTSMPTPAGSTAGARPFGSSKATTIGRTGTAAGARAVSAVKRAMLGPAGTSAQAGGLASSKATALGRAGSSAGARAPSVSKATALGPAGTSAQAGGLASSKATTVGRAGSSAGTRAFVERGGLGRIGESSLTRPLGPTSKATAIGRAGSLAGAPPLVAVKRVTLGRAGGIAAARPLGVEVVEVLGPLGTVAGARALSSLKATALGRAGSSAGARPVGPYVAIWPLRAAGASAVGVGSGAVAVERAASGVIVVERVASGAANVR